MENQKHAYRQQFLIEARDILDIVAGEILAVEADPANVDLLNAIFRGIHTIKGSAPMFDMDTLGELAHELENLLNGLRCGSLALTPEIVDVLLKGVDGLNSIHISIARGETPQLDEPLQELIRTLTVTETAARADTHPQAGAVPAGERAALPADLLEELRELLACSSVAQHLDGAAEGGHPSTTPLRAFDMLCL